MSEVLITSNEIEQAREIWKLEKNKYDRYGKSIIKRLEKAFKKARIPLSLSYRTKETDSLLKKMLKNRIKYDDLTDKVGARVTVHFKSDLLKAKEIIEDLFGKRILKTDDKKNNMDYKTFDYLSIHFDVANNISNPTKVCELQLRTVCQNAWAELSHILTYNPVLKFQKKLEGK